MNRRVRALPPLGRWFLGVVVLGLAANLAGFVLAYVLAGHLPYGEPYREHKRAFAKRNLQACRAPHPFFGNINCDDLPIAGQFSDGEPLLRVVSPTSQGKPVKVLILGGSVAVHLSRNGSAAGSIAPAVVFEGGELDHNNILQKMLQRHFQVDRFEIHNAALPGGKQPQQLFKLLYLLTQGQTYDIVINLDGFNEIALPAIENRQSGDWPTYPRSYSRLVQSVSIGHDLECIPRSNRYAGAPNPIPALEAWELFYVRRCHVRVEALGVGIDNPLAKAARFAPTEEAATVDESTRIWRESSRAIAKLATAYGFDYIHVIQPNQYLPGAKPLSEEERTRFLTHRGYGRVIQAYYRRLDAKSISTAEAPVTVVDLRDLFQDRPETLYRDACCHMSNLGMALVSRAIVNQAERVFARRLRP